jgi:hypothetical protein
MTLDPANIGQGKRVFRRRLAARQSSSGVPPLNLSSKQRRDAAATFTPEQLAWLHLIRDHVATSLSIEPDDLDLSPFNQRGGLAKAYQLFGDALPALLEELKSRLAA